MKKRTNFLLIITGVILFVPFQYFKFSQSIKISDQYLHLFGIAAMVGIIIIMIALLSLSSKIELKIINKNNVSGEKDKELVK